MGKHAPCKDCINREVGCHGSCALYKDWQRDHDKELKTIKKQKGKENTYHKKGLKKR